MPNDLTLYSIGKSGDTPEICRNILQIDVIVNKSSMTAYLNHSNMFASTLAYFSPPTVGDWKS